MHIVCNATEKIMQVFELFRKNYWNAARDWQFWSCAHVGGSELAQGQGNLPFCNQHDDKLIQ